MVTLYHGFRDQPRGNSLRALLAISLVVVMIGLAPRATAAQRLAHAPFSDAGAVTYASANATNDLDPVSMGVYEGNLMVTRNTFETLVQYDGSDVNHFVPLLATSWQSSDDDAVWTFHLRHGVRFHTGRCCMTADDVKYSITRIVGAGQAAAFLFARYMSDPLKQIKVLDPYTVRFDLGRPQHTFIRAIASKLASLIEDAQAIRRHASKSDPWGHNWATDHDAGTGPYMLRSWQRGQQVVLTRFPGYWGGWNGAHFSSVVIRTVPEPATRREMLERGQADVTFGLTPQDDVALSANRAVTVVAPYGFEVDYLAMTQYGPLASPYARQALSYAFDYTAFLRAGYLHFARQAYGPLPRIMIGFDPRGFHYRTDLARARALLAKAGVRPGTTLTYAYGSDYTAAKPAGLILQAQLAQLGLTLKLQEVASAAYSSILFGNDPPSKRPNLMYYAWWPDFNDPYDMTALLLGSSFAGPAGANIGYYHDARVDALLARLKYDGGTALLRDASQLQDVTTRVDPTAIWLDEPAQVTILTRTLRGYVFNPIDLQTYDFYTMYHASR